MNARSNLFERSVWKLALNGLAILWISSSSVLFANLYAEFIPHNQPLPAVVPLTSDDETAKDDTAKDETAKDEKTDDKKAEDVTKDGQAAAAPPAVTDTNPAAPPATGEPAAAMPPAAAAAAPSTAAPPVVESLNVFPQQISLGHSLDRQSLVAQINWSHGITSDVSAAVAIEVADTNIARVENRIVLPVADGQTVLRATYETFSLEIPIVVTNASLVPNISFQNDVMPVFSKTGCNAGSCHGAARGKDGFQLSLYGFDPNGDYHRLTREMLGRRINLAMPEDCLLINKATGDVSHTGGGLMSRDSEYHDTLVRWLEAGAPRDTGPVPTVTKIEIFPNGGVLDGENEGQQLTVRATYSDGANRDVTSLAYFMTSNDNSATVDQTGVVTAKNRGEAFVMARFDTHTEGVQFIVLPKALEFQWAAPPEHNYIDSLVNAKLKNLRINPSELCSDEEFIRRVFIDIAASTPSSAEVLAFAADTNPDKRAVLIDQLLERKEFVEMWVMKWSELLQIRSNPQVSYKATLLYYNWLQQQISDNVPVDAMVRQLLGAEGGTFTNAATNYYQNEQDTLKVAENVAQVFLGTRIQCAQCHNHPFDRWTMSDYYQFAAFFSQVGRKPGTDPREQIIFNRGSGEINHPVSKQVMPPKFLGGDTPDVTGKDRRVVMAEWLASKENHMFSQNLANIVWAHFFGRGIVNEVDDVRISNPPSNPQLIAELGKKFGEYDFDFKKIVRDICNSRTYQLSTQTNPTNESDVVNFSHAQLRRIRAEVMLDVISAITETDNKFRGLPMGARAVQIADGNTTNYFLTTFGRAQRETVCSCEVKMEPNLSQALHLLNGETVHDKILQGKVIDKLLAAGKTPAEVLDELYLRCFARLPSDADRQAMEQELALTEDKAAVLVDIFWSLLNGREFVFNH